MSSFLSKLFAIAQTYGSKVAVIVNAGIALYQLYKQLEPSAKAQVDTELGKLNALVQSVKTDATAFESDGIFSKPGDSLTLLNAVLGGVTILKGVYADGETLFKSDWAQVAAIIDTLKAQLVGTATPAVASPATAAGPAITTS